MGFYCYVYSFLCFFVIDLFFKAKSLQMCETGIIFKAAESALSAERVRIQKHEEVTEMNHKLKLNSNKVLCPPSCAALPAFSCPFLLSLIIFSLLSYF